MFKRLARLAGLDSQVVSTLLLRVWQVLAGVTTVLIVPIWLGKVEQGYYYTFASLLALQIFFELGMNQVILQLVSHDFAHIKNAAGRLTGDADRISRLAALIGLLRYWYGTAALLFFVIVSVSGGYFFSTKGDLPISDWGGPWLILTLVTAVNLYFSSSLTVLEGCGELVNVSRMRLLQSICGSALMWIALAFGAGLWVMPLVPLISAMHTAYWLRMNGGTLKSLSYQFVDRSIKAKIKWRTDILPFQWRIAVSWISGYFIFQLFTPIVFARLGAVEAGRLGISMAVFSALLSVGMSWVNAKLPAFAAHVSRGERARLNALFKDVVKRSGVFTLIAILMVIAAVLLSIVLDVAAVHRFASLPVVFSLAVITLCNCLIFAAAAYMRAHKEEPMMWVSVVTGLATLLAAAVGSLYSVITMMALCALITVCLTLPWTALLFMRYYRRQT